MRAQCRHQDRNQNDTATDHPVGFISIAVEGADRVAVGWHQQKSVHKDRHPGAARPAKKRAPGLYGGSLVIVSGQFWHQRRAGRLVYGNQGTDQHCQNDEVEEKRLITPIGWLPQQRVTACNRYSRCVHERMTAPPPRARIVRPVTHHRVTQRIKNQRNEQRGADQSGLQTHDGPVKQQQKIGEAVIFDAIGNGAKAEGHA